MSETTFSQLQLGGEIKAGTDPETIWFPVFLVGKDLVAPQPPMSMGSCELSPSRKVEGFEVTFGKPGSARDLDGQDAADVADGPGEGGWKILLGFVQTNKDGNAFTEFATENGGIRRRYVGVRADEVAAQSDVLTLRTSTASKDDAKKPLLVLNGADDGLLQYGPVDSAGNLKAVFTVDADGNVKAEGKISGALTTGGMQVESGIATDGMILPLPPGITQKQVDDDEAIVQVQVSLRLTGETAPPSLAPPVAGAHWGAFPLETFVDSERRLHCRVRWFQLLGGTAIEDHPGACNYTVLASVKEKKE